MSNMSIQESHQQNLNNENLQQQMKIIPIDWDEILKHTSNIVRDQAADVVNRMNGHVALWMNGPNIGKLRIERHLRFENRRSVFDTITVAVAKQLFNRKIQLRWKEAGEQKKLSDNVISFWLKSPQLRKEIYHTPVRTPYRRSPLVKWLETSLNDPLGFSIVRFNSFNPRKIIYESFLPHVNSSEDWTPKKISQEFYKMMPLTKPEKGLRCRKRGISCIFIPSVDYCSKLLKNWQSEEINLVF
jgi:hypothetical protein